MNNTALNPHLRQANVSRRLFKIQLKVQGEWVGDREFKSIAELVRYANNYHGYNLEYNRIKYHLNRYKEHQFDRKCGEWQARLLAVC
jgi:hypothetical protein